MSESIPPSAGFQRPVDPAALGIDEPHIDIDPRTPSPARMYDYYLDGKDNFPADREAAERVLQAVPHGRAIAQANRRFLMRAVRFLAEQGIEQFIDLGTGIPTSPNVHEVAHEINPAARVVYVDNDPIVTVHNRALRQTHDGVVSIRADLRRPDEVLGHPDLRELIDVGRPVGLLAIAVLHFVSDEDDPQRLTADLLRPLAIGSHLALSHVSWSDAQGATRITTAARNYTHASAPAVPRGREEIAELFAGTRLVDPGLVPVHTWRAEEDAPGDGVMLYGGVGVAAG